MHARNFGAPNFRGTAVAEIEHADGQACLLNLCLQSQYDK
jgi:hypothetical protein